MIKFVCNRQIQEFFGHQNQNLVKTREINFPDFQIYHWVYLLISLWPWNENNIDLINYRPSNQTHLEAFVSKYKRTLFPTLKTVIFGQYWKRNKLEPLLSRKTDPLGKKLMAKNMITTLNQQLEMIASKVLKVFKKKKKICQK